MWPTHCCLFRRKKVEMPHHYTFRNLAITPNSSQAKGLWRINICLGIFISENLVFFMDFW
jgi:hypothetical protein